MGRNKLSIYPDDVKIVPETVANENITVTDANGRSIRAAEIKRDADGESGYYVTLASDMVNGTYTFTMLLQEKLIHRSLHITIVYGVLWMRRRRL